MTGILTTAGTKVPLSRSGRLPPVQVLTVIDSLGVGGAEALLPTLAAHLDTDRFRMHVLALDTVPPNQITSALRELTDGLIRWQPRGLLDARRYRELAAVIERLDIDVVHTHLLYGNVHGALGAWLARRPVVATLHNGVPTYRRGARLKRHLELIALRRSNARVIAVAEEVRQAYLGRGGLRSERITVIPNAIDLRRFGHVSEVDVVAARLAVMGSSRGPMILAVGRVAEQKGHEHLVAAMPGIVSRFPGAMLIIAGRLDAPQQVEEQIREHRLHERVRLLGSRTDVAALLAAADVFVMPSLWEGLPLALIEAMAIGVPTVATTVGGIPELMVSGETGLLVPPADAEALCRAMLTLLDAPDYAAQLGARARVVAEGRSAVPWASQIMREYDLALTEKASQFTERLPVR